MFSFRNAAAVLLLGALSGCPTSRRAPDDQDAGVDFVGRSCNVDAECGSLRCDKIRRQCICLSDQSCLSSRPDDPVRYCNNYTGLCVSEITGCKQDSDCLDSTGQVDPTQYCDSSIRTCRSRKSFCEACAFDFECGGQGDKCLADPRLNARFCGKACSVNADCARGATCQSFDGVKQCWPAPVDGGVGQSTCESFRGCTPDSLRSCNSNSDCADLGDQRCDPAQGKCTAIEQVCPFGTVCDPRNKICVLECAADADCGDPLLRCSNRVCEPLSECQNDAQCPANKVCSVAPGQTVGQCEPFCQNDLDCPLAQTCQKVGEKFRCAPGCSSDSNCPIEQRCDSSTQLCEGPVIGSIRICQATAACNACELCDPVLRECYSAKSAYPYCKPCTSNGDCAGGACVLMGAQGYCAKYCGAGQDCPQGFACLSISSGSSACVPSDRQCAGKCP